ncbi:hypothetical protein U1Q18_044661 [Sarracenia purpurea var. burkii]
MLPPFTLFYRPPKQPAVFTLRLYLLHLISCCRCFVEAKLVSDVTYVRQCVLRPRAQQPNCSVGLGAIIESTKLRKPIIGYVPWKGQITQTKKAGKFYTSTYAALVEFNLRGKIHRNEWKLQQTPVEDVKIRTVVLIADNWSGTAIMGKNFAALYDLDCRKVGPKTPWATINKFGKYEVSIRMDTFHNGTSFLNEKRKNQLIFQEQNIMFR